MSIFNQEKTKLSDSEKGFDWPLDVWYIERILFLVYGGITAFCIFLYFVFYSNMFLILAMFAGVAQVVFAIMGFDIVAKTLISMGIKEKQNI